MPQVEGASPAPYATLGQNSGSANLLGPLTQFAYAQNALNQNAMFQQQFRARAAMGPLAQASVDPETGQMDYNKFATLISTHPETAFMAPEVINQLVQRQLTQSQVVKTNLDIEAQKRDVINNGLAGLVNLGPNVKNTDVMKMLTSPEMAPFVDPKHVVGMLASMPAGGQQLAQVVQQHALASAGAAKALDYVRGQWQEATLPDGSKQGGFASPVSGFTPVTQSGGTYGPGGSGPGPGASAPPPPPGAPSAPMAPPGTSPQGASAPTTFGGVPSSPASAPPASAPPAPAPGLNAGGQPTSGAGAPTITSLSPYRSAQLGDVSKYESDLNDRSQTANQLLALFGQVRGYLKNFTPGGGSEFQSELATLAQRAGLPQTTVDQIAGGNLGSIQAARKLFFGVGSQIAAQMIHASGGRMTQSEWAQTLLKGSPNIDLDPRGITNIMNSMRDLASYTRSEQDFFNMKKGIQGYDLTRAQNDWQKVYGTYLDKRYGGQ